MDLFVPIIDNTTSFRLQIGRTVPSVNPRQLSRAAPFDERHQQKSSNFPLKAIADRSSLKGDRIDEICGQLLCCRALRAVEQVGQSLEINCHAYMDRQVVGEKEIDLQVKQQPLHYKILGVREFKHMQKLRNICFPKVKFCPTFILCHFLKVQARMTCVGFLAYLSRERAEIPHHQSSLLQKNAPKIS